MIDLRKYHRDHKLRALRADRYAARYLAVVERRRARATQLRPVRLVAFRQGLRKMISDGPIVELDKLTQCSGSERKQIAIWLLGRCRLKLATPVLIDCFHESTDPAIRKEAARALRRIGAWAELRAIAKLERPGSRVHRLATPRPPRALSDRLSRLLGPIDQRDARAAAVRPPRTGFFASFQRGSGRPAKSIAVIRRLLEHIRSLIHGPRGNAEDKP